MTRRQDNRAAHASDRSHTRRSANGRSRSGMHSDHVRRKSRGRLTPDGNVSLSTCPKRSFAKRLQGGSFGPPVVQHTVASSITRLSGSSVGKKSSHGGSAFPARHYGRNSQRNNSLRQESRPFLGRGQPAGRFLAEQGISIGGDDSISEIPDRSRNQPQQPPGNHPETADSPQDAGHSVGPIQSLASIQQHDRRIVVIGACSQPRAGRFPLKRRKPEPSTCIPPQQEVDGPVTQPAHPVKEHDGAGKRNALRIGRDGRHAAQYRSSRGTVSLSRPTSAKDRANRPASMQKSRPPSQRNQPLECVRPTQVFSGSLRVLRNVAHTRPSKRPRNGSSNEVARDCRRSGFPGITPC